MAKYSDEEIRQMSKVTCKIAADYLGVSPMSVSFGVREEKLPIGFVVHNKDKWGVVHVTYYDILLSYSV